MEKIVKKYLGINEPKIVKLNIGSQNETYNINDKYIIKVFNKDTISNKDDQIIRESKEKIAETAKRKGVYAILPYKYNGKYIQKEGMYFSIYPYIKYKSIIREEISIKHIIELAKLVTKLHEITFNIPLSNNIKARFNIDYDKYINFHKANDNIRDLLVRNKADLKKLEDKINNALEKLKDKQVISHNDIKLENVLWNKFKPYLIDWDAAGYINHMCAANEYAYFWSVNEGRLNKEYYEAFMKNYLDKHKCIDDIYDVIYATLHGKFAWLQYSLERSTYINELETKKGEEAIISLIEEFSNYEKNIPEMINVYNELMGKNKNKDCKNKQNVIE